MDKGFISSKSVKATLSDIMEKFIEFANLVIHDEEFLKCVNGLLPFGGVAHASMNVVPERQTIKKMGVMVMRMDMVGQELMQVPQPVQSSSCQTGAWGVGVPTVR